MCTRTVICSKQHQVVHRWQHRVRSTKHTITTLSILLALMEVGWGFFVNSSKLANVLQKQHGIFRNSSMHVVLVCFAMLFCYIKHVIVYFDDMKNICSAEKPFLKSIQY